MIGGVYLGGAYPAGFVPTGASAGVSGLPLGSVFAEWLAGPAHSRDMLIIVRELVDNPAPHELTQTDNSTAKGQTK